MTSATASDMTWNYIKETPYASETYIMLDGGGREKVLSAMESQIAFH